MENAFLDFMKFDKFITYVFKYHYYIVTNKIFYFENKISIILKTCSDPVVFHQINI